MKDLIKVSQALVLKEKLGFMGPDILQDTMRAVNAARKGSMPKANTPLVSSAKPAAPSLSSSASAVSNPATQMGPGAGTINPVSQLLTGGVNAY
jgi:hypothetical protein